jgi:hypothetical protein
MSPRRTLIVVALLLPGIGSLLIALLFGQSDAPIAQWCVRYWWIVMVSCALSYGAAQLFFFLKDRGYVST